MRINDRILASSAYLFGIPALYIILTANRKKPYVGQHGARAFFLWVFFLAVFFGVRALNDYVWSRNFIPQLERLETAAVVLMGIWAFFLAFQTFFKGRIRAKRGSLP
jgi:hypothetical protein